MAIWIELHCDVLGDAVDKYGHARCAGKNGTQIGGMAQNASNVQDRIRYLAHDAKLKGWRITRGKYTCQACLTSTKDAP